MKTGCRQDDCRICRDRPATLVEDKGFRRIVNALDPRYTLPSRRKLTRTLLPDLYWEQYGQLKSELDGASPVAYFELSSASPAAYAMLPSKERH